MVKVSLERVSKGFESSNVSKAFGAVKALQEVSVNIAEGELFLMVGPSGCGKTTALRVIAGFYKPDIGYVKFDEKEVSDLPPYNRNTGSEENWNPLTEFYGSRRHAFWIRVFIDKKDDAQRQKLQAACRKIEEVRWVHM